MNNYINTFFGYTDNMKPLQKARTENILNKKYRYDGIVMSRKEYMYKLLQEKGTAKIEDNYSYYSEKTQAMTKPKKDYRIYYNIKDNGEIIKVFQPVIKTEYDYFVYLQLNGFIDTLKANQFVIDEQNHIQAEQEAQTKIKQLKRKTEEKEIKEQEQFQLWLNEQTLSYNNTAKIELQKEIWLNIIGNYSTNAIKLLVLIDNIEKPRCKAELRNWLHLYNKGSLKTFECITGIDLGNTEKEISKVIDNITKADFKEMKDFKLKQKHEQKAQETFYKIILNANGKRKFVACLATPFSKYGLDLFIQKENGKVNISEALTGLLMCQNKTKKGAIQNLDKVIEKHGIDNVKQIINDAIKKNGVNPRYQEQKEGL